MTKLHHLTIELDQRKKEEENFQREMEVLSVTNMKGSTKIQELKGKLDQMSLMYK